MHFRARGRGRAPVPARRRELAAGSGRHALGEPLRGQASQRRPVPVDPGGPVTPPTLPKTIFVGQAGSGICLYRCTLPAMALHLDWISAAGDPPHAAVRTGLTKRPVGMADLASYEVVILQQPFAPGWRQVIRDLQDAGTTVLFEIDDYVHAVGKMDSHELQGFFTKELLQSADMNMRLADGVICST